MLPQGPQQAPPDPPMNVDLNQLSAHLELLKTLIRNNVIINPVPTNPPPLQLSPVLPFVFPNLFAGFGLTANAAYNMQKANLTWLDIFNLIPQNNQWSGSPQVIQPGQFMNVMPAAGFHLPGPTGFPFYACNNQNVNVLPMPNFPQQIRENELINDVEDIQEGIPIEPDEDPVLDDLLYSNHSPALVGNTGGYSLVKGFLTPPMSSSQSPLSFSTSGVSAPQQITQSQDSVRGEMNLVVKNMGNLQVNPHSRLLGSPAQHTPPPEPSRGPFYLPPGIQRTGDCPMKQFPQWKVSPNPPVQLYDRSFTPIIINPKLLPITMPKRIELKDLDFAFYDSAPSGDGGAMRPDHQQRDRNGVVVQKQPKRPKTSAIHRWIPDAVLLNMASRPIYLEKFLCNVELAREIASCACIVKDRFNLLEKYVCSVTGISCGVFREWSLVARKKKEDRISLAEWNALKRCWCEMAIWFYKINREPHFFPCLEVINDSYKFNTECQYSKPKNCCFTDSEKVKVELALREMETPHVYGLQGYF